VFETMKIGIYDEFLKTAGGGEKHIGVIAEHLSKNHDVEFISRKDADLSQVAERLGLDFSKIALKKWPDVEETYLDDLTCEYDLFINSTFFSAIHSKAKKSAYLVFFPVVLNKGYPIFLKKLVLNTLGIFFKKRDEMFHIVGEEKSPLRTDFRIRDGEFRFIFDNDAKNPELLFVELLSQKLSDLILKVTKNNLEIEFKVDSKHLYIKNSFQKGDLLTIEFNKSSMILNENPDREYYLESPYYFRIRSLNFKAKNIFTTLINKVVQSDGFAGKILGMFYGVYLKQKASFRVAGSLKTYDLLMANSRYTQQWISKLYSLHSEIVYPPIDIDQFAPGNKQNIIMSVGRFFPPKYGHCKKQFEMVQFFKKAYDKYPELKSYEYHLCGGVKDEPESKEYFEACQKEAEGYPIFFHPNIPFEDLKEYYAKAKIFWHASGYHEDSRSPELAEHFGMTTVEAMSAGVVPVVIAKGGQIEIISQGKNGFLWDDESEIIQKTIHIIRDEHLRLKLMEGALMDSRKYSRKKMLESFDKLFEKYLA
jgi:glycosyltransferase involved in cell wall biosynthesis